MVWETCDSTIWPPLTQGNGGVPLTQGNGGVPLTQGNVPREQDTWKGEGTTEEVCSDNFGCTHIKILPVFCYGRNICNFFQIQCQGREIIYGDPCTVHTVNM